MNKLHANNVTEQRNEHAEMNHVKNVKECEGTTE